MSDGLKPTDADRVRELEAEVERLRAAVRAHRDERGDDRCHGDNGRLYAALPEGDTRPARETLVTIENCRRFIACQEEPGRVYVSPQRRIEQLEALLRRLVDARRAGRRAAEEEFGVVEEARKLLEGTP